MKPVTKRMGSRRWPPSKLGLVSPARASGSERMAVDDRLHVRRGRRLPLLLKTAVTRET